VCALKSCSIWPKLQDVTFTSAIFMSYAMFYLQSRGAAGDYECDHIHASYSKQLNPNELNRLKCDLVNLNHKTLFCFMGAVFQKNWRKQ